MEIPNTINNTENIKNLTDILYSWVNIEQNKNKNNTNNRLYTKLLFSLLEDIDFVRNDLKKYINKLNPNLEEDKWNNNLNQLKFIMYKNDLTPNDNDNNINKNELNDNDTLTSVISTTDEDMNDNDINDNNNDINNNNNDINDKNIFSEKYNDNFLCNCGKKYKTQYHYKNHIQNCDYYIY